jgi:hypothetical protein
MTDLCTLADVKFYGQLSSSIHDERISSMITYTSTDIMREANNASLTSNDHNAKMACIYGVLIWLKNENKIPNPSAKKTISAMSDGHVSREYYVPKQKITSPLEDPNSYESKYEHYMLNLMALPPAGTYDDNTYGDEEGYGDDGFVISSTEDDDVDNVTFVEQIDRIVTALESLATEDGGRLEDIDTVLRSFLVIDE